MKLMITVDLYKFAKEYNGFAAVFDEETLTIEKVYKMLEVALGNDLYTVIEAHSAILTAEELERFAGQFIGDGWKEISLDKASRISFCPARRANSLENTFGGQMKT